MLSEVLTFITTENFLNLCISSFLYFKNAINGYSSMIQKYTDFFYIVK